MKYITPTILLFSTMSAIVCASTVEKKVLTLPVETLSGKTINLGQYKGKKPVYLKFWATWCQTCREQMPHLQQIQDKYGKKIKIIAINLGVNDDLNSVKATKKEFKLTMPIAIDTSGELAQSFNLIGTPYHILIGKEGNIVHKGHKASKALDKKIQLLAASKAKNLPGVTLISTADSSIEIKNNTKKVTALFFVATWCDWYLKKSRPSMSKNCIDGQNLINKLTIKFPQIQWNGVASRLWTGEKELKKYKKKFAIPYPLTIDTSNAVFLKYKVKSYPTLILVKNGIEVARVEKFDNQKKLTDKLIKHSLH